MEESITPLKHIKHTDKFKNSDRKDRLPNGVEVKWSNEKQLKIVPEPPKFNKTDVN